VRRAQQRLIGRLLDVTALHVAKHTEIRVHQPVNRGCLGGIERVQRSTTVAPNDAQERLDRRVNIAWKFRVGFKQPGIEFV
jgi:hypothetical protein